MVDSFLLLFFHVSSVTECMTVSMLKNRNARQFVSHKFRFAFLRLVLYFFPFIFLLSMERMLERIYNTRAHKLHRSVAHFSSALLYGPRPRLIHTHTHANTYIRHRIHDMITFLFMVCIDYIHGGGCIDDMDMRCWPVLKNTSIHCA